MRVMSWTVAILTTCVALSMPMPAGAGNEAEPVAGKYGAPVTVKKAVSVAKVQKDPARFEGKTLRLEGVVKAVCQGAGCWVEIEDSKGASFIAKSLDESVLLPKDCKGSRIVVQGVMTMMAAKGHDHAGHEHAAHEAAEGHSCPAPTYLLSTQGIELLAARK